jgi:5'-nucleotidase
MTNPPAAESDRPLIIVTNDDGYDAPGLLALAGALKDLADLAVIAPDHNWSATGHSRTLFAPIHTREVLLADGTPALATSGSPADCVALGLLGLTPRPPDLVVSGINGGANVGHDLTYSGTVAGAREGAIHGVPAIAASLDVKGPAEFGTAARVVARLVARLLANLPKRMTLLNVNVPAIPEDEIRGLQVTRIGERIYRDVLLRREDPRGQPYYWIGGDPPTGVAAPGTDIGALAAGYVSVTPLLLDPTDYPRLDQLATLL